NRPPAGRTSTTSPTRSSPPICVGRRCGRPPPSTATPVSSNGPSRSRTHSEAGQSGKPWRSGCSRFPRSLRGVDPLGELLSLSRPSLALKPLPGGQLLRRHPLGEPATNSPREVLGHCRHVQTIGP